MSIGLTATNRCTRSGATSKARMSQPFSVESVKNISRSLVATSPTRTFFSTLRYEDEVVVKQELDVIVGFVLWKWQHKFLLISLDLSTILT